MLIHLRSADHVFFLHGKSSEFIAQVLSPLTSELLMFALAALVYILASRSLTVPVKKKSGEGWASSGSNESYFCWPTFERWVWTYSRISRGPRICGFVSVSAVSARLGMYILESWSSQHHKGRQAWIKWMNSCDLWHQDPRRTSERLRGHGSHGRRRWRRSDHEDLISAVVETWDLYGFVQFPSITHAGGSCYPFWSGSFSQ